jgi:phosphoglycerate dehydrogenase-like enzyme
VSRRPNALVAWRPEANLDTLSAAQAARLRTLVTLLRDEPVVDLAAHDVAALLPQVEVLVTGWGAPQISGAVLDAMPALRLIAHCAGTVKSLVDGVAFERGVAVVSAADANALPVAEFTLAVILLGNKRILKLREMYRAERRSLKPVRERAPGLGNYRKTVGIVGASRVGRRVIELLRPFDFDVVVFDPYLSAADALALGVRKSDLDSLMASADVVSVHAPATAETRRLIDRRRLGLLRDGAVFVNTARASLVDQDALIDEARSGRIDVVLDVTDPEPLPADSPLYDLPNVLLTPHIAGAVGTEVQRLSALALDEIARYTNGEPLQHCVDPSLLERSA